MSVVKRGRKVFCWQLVNRDGEHGGMNIYVDYSHHITDYVYLLAVDLFYTHYLFYDHTIPS